MITYINYTAGSTKSGTKQGDLFNNPFQLGEVNPNYTANAVVETMSAAGDFTAMWTPIVKDAFVKVDGKGGVEVLGDAKIVDKDGNITYKNFTDDGKLTGLNEGDKVAYK